MNNKKTKISAVSQTRLGVYVWQLPSGEFLSDEDVNVLSISAMRGDIKAMSLITQAAKSYGFPDGNPVFLEGARKITDEELQEQIWRMNNGLVPDPLDIGVYKDEMNKNR